MPDRHPLFRLLNKGRSMRRIALATAQLLATAIVLFELVAQASAHHAWTSQDTRYAYYIAGVVTYVRWGNPHVEIHVQVDNSPPPIAGHR
jgi:hypothetical protein